MPKPLTRRLKRWRLAILRASSPKGLMTHEPLAQKMGLSLRDARLWRPHRHTFSMGAAVGACISFWVPFAQIPLALVVSAWLRVNLWGSALGTLVNTPLTYAPVYWAAAQLGQALWPGLNLVQATLLGSLVLGPLVGALVYGLLYGFWTTLSLRWPSLKAELPTSTRTAAESKAHP